MPEARQAGVQPACVDLLYDEVKVDTYPETLERKILRPYRSRAPVTINGKTVDIGAVQRVQVSASEEPSTQIVERLRAEDRSSSVVIVGGPDYNWRAAARASDVTDHFITGPPGSASPTLAGCP